MMEERINQALVQLESDLKNLSSAREQVEKTVKSGNDLQKTVGEYIVIVRTFCDSLKNYEDYLNVWEDNLRARGTSLGHEIESAIADIERSCSTVITHFNTKVDDIKNSFQTETKKTLDSFIEENSKLSTHIEELNSLRTQIKETSNEIQLVKESLYQISKDLKESQDEQDEALNDIQQKVTNLPLSVHEVALSIIQAVANSETILKEAVNATSAKTEELFNKTNILSSNVDGLNTLCQNINSSVISSTTNLTNVLIASKDEVNNKLTSEFSKAETSIANLKAVSDNIITAIGEFSGQVVPVLNSLNENEQKHYNAIIKQLEEQENRLNTEFDVVRKQNKIYSIVIIVLLAIIIGLLTFYR